MLATTSAAREAAYLLETGGSAPHELAMFQTIYRIARVCLHEEAQREVKAEVTLRDKELRLYHHLTLEQQISPKKSARLTGPTAASDLKAVAQRLRALTCMLNKPHLQKATCCDLLSILQAANKSQHREATSRSTSSIEDKEHGEPSCRCIIL